MATDDRIRQQHPACAPIQHPSYAPTGPDLTLAACRLRLSTAQERLAAVRSREVGRLHSDRARWEQDHADAAREVRDATTRLAALEQE